MKQRYNRGMENIQPSPEFLNRLEREMNRTLRAPRRHTAVKIAVSAAVLTALLLGALFLRAPLPDRVKPDPLMEASATPTVFPTASAESTETAQRRGAWPEHSLGYFDNLSLNLADRAYPIRSDASLDSPVVFTLQPGEAWWPKSIDKSTGTICAQYWDGESLQNGWLCPDEGTPVDPVPYTVIHLPGKLREDAPLRYARDESSPAAAEMSKDSLVYVYASIGDWCYVTDDGFNNRDRGYKPVRMGWLPADSLELLEWRDPAALRCTVELLADRVNLRKTPGGEVVATLSREEVIHNNVSWVTYNGETVEFEGKRWYLVSYAFRDYSVWGFISADYVRVDPITLGDELNLDDVVSAELCVTQSDGETVDHTFTLLEGDPRMKALCERLKAASHRFVGNELTSPVTARINLTFDDGDTETLTLSGSNLEYNGIIYTYLTPSEIGEIYVHRAYPSVEDILSQYFEGYREIIQNR